ncbi:MAG: HesA/MoeB/ThiF family protein [Hyphomicrobiales bacterium]|jgi:molybdopterin/thiamine biosynthesis adenylyltransferase|nr:HesA/MoeB/ThiF family protein [Hyphomicrobiales bacterium]
MNKKIKSISLNNQEIERYSKQILIKNIGGNGQRQLKSSNVLVIGAGGLGSPVITHLTSSGIGKIGLIDNDIVDLSNLQRQYIHGTSRLGEYKTESAKYFINELNPNIVVNIFNIDANDKSIDNIIPNYDVIIDCTDNFQTRYRIADSCEFYKKPYIIGMVRGYEGHVTTIFPNTESIKKNPRIRDLFDENSVQDMQDSCADQGVLSITTGLIGTLMAAEAIKIILNIKEVLIGKLLIVDLLNTKFETINYSSND